MAEHPNVTVAREASEALSRGDIETAASYLADDVVWHEIGRAEPRRGKAALMAGAGATDFEITGRIHDVVGNDEHVVVLVDATATRGGRTLQYRTAEILHVKDGKIAERWAFSDDTARIVAFFA
jgi:ketosteroid isomerase-like protein